MPDFPPGTFPVVFESGVLRFDDDGTLSIFLTHSAEDPHPMQVQEHDDEATIPGKAAKGVLVGTGGQHWRSRASLPETDELPEGFVFTFRRYSSATVEMSGDLSVLVEGAVEAPSWFVPGKVHRFAGPDERLQMWSGSGKPPESAPQPVFAGAAGPGPGPLPSGSSPRPGSSSSSGSASSSSGCLGLLLAGLLLPLGLLALA